MPGSEYVIKYISDYTGVVQGVKAIRALNTDMAKTLGSQFVKATEIIDSSFNKISSKQVKIDGKNLLKTVGDIKTVFRGADGTVQSFTKRVTYLNGQLVPMKDEFGKLRGSLQNVTSDYRVLNNEMEKSKKPFLSLIGQSSQLATNYNNLSNVNKTFSGHLKEYGQAMEVISSKTVKVSDNTKKIESVVKLADGSFVKLNETIKRTPDNMQKISRSAGSIGSNYENLTKSQQSLIGSSSQLQTNFQNLGNINQHFKSELSSVGTVIGTVGDSMLETGKGFSKVSQIVETDTGKFFKLSEITRNTANGIRTVDKSLKDVTGQFVKTDVETAKASKNFASLGDNIGRLAKRALITIPVWMALRAVMMGTFKAIRDGFKTLVDQDKAWQKAKRTIQGTTSEIAESFDKLRASTTKLSLETGESVENITKAFYKFSTVGFDYETSMKGAEYATKTAIVMFGDAEETANAFARAMRVLVDKSAGAKTASQQMGEAMALTAELWKDNAFELSEFTQSLEKFAGTAKSTNFTTQQTIALLSALSTAGLRGGRAGRLLKTSVLKLLVNFDKLSKVLGVKVNPELDTTFTAFMKVLDAIQDLDKGSKIAKETASVIGDLFGGAKGSELILSLKAISEHLKKNLGQTGDINKLEKAYDEVSKTLSRQVEIFHNINKEGGKAFVSAIVGGEDFKDSLGELSSILKEVYKYLAIVAEGSSIAFRFQFNPKGLLELYINTKKQAKKMADVFYDSLRKGLEGKLNKKELEDLLTDFDVKIKDRNINLDKDFLKNTKNKLKKQLQQAVDESSEGLSVDIPEISISFKEQQDIAKMVLEIELDRLQTLGATNSQLLSAESLYLRQLGIEEDTLDKVKRKLEYEKAINEEKRLQNKLGSDSMKLFEIAQTEGEDIAKKIGGVLAGDIDFSAFVRSGGKAVEVFARDFGDKFKQQQAEAYFKGERVPELPAQPKVKKTIQDYLAGDVTQDKPKELSRWGGKSIPIEEEAIRGIPSTIQIEKAFKELKELKIYSPNKVVVYGEEVSSKPSQTTSLDKLSTKLDKIIPKKSEEPLQNVKQNEFDFAYSMAQKGEIRDKDYSKGIMQEYNRATTPEEKEIVPEKEDKTDKIIREMINTGIETSLLTGNMNAKPLYKEDENMIQGIVNRSIGASLITGSNGAIGDTKDITQNTINVRLDGNVDMTEQNKKQIEKSFRDMGTPGTKENKQLIKGMTGSTQIPTI